MNRIISAALELQSFLVRQEWQFCFIGGIAVLRWGMPRTTQDVDVSLFVEFGKEAATIKAVLGEFEPRIENAAQFAMESKVILTQSSDNVPFDILISQFEFEQNIILRATHFEFLPGRDLLTVSAEDLVVMKAFAGRPQDWADVEGIISANKNLDQTQILSELSQLADLMPDRECLDELRRLFRSTEQ